MRIRLTLAMVTFAAMMSATAAQAVDLCRLAATTDFATASAAMEAAGCSLRDEAGLTFRSFNCPKEAVAAVQMEDETLTILLPAWTADTLDVTCNGKAWRVLPTPYDNPLIMKLMLSDTSYDATRVALLGMNPESPYLLWICIRGYACRNGFDRKLTEVLERFLGAGVLTYASSEVRVAGLDITRAKREVLEQALVERGGVVGEREGNDLVKSVVLDKVEGVPGLGVVKIIYMADDIVSVRYAIRQQSDYVAFSQSLDSRYGASKPSPEQGCVSRLWKDGGVSIIGEFCASRPDDSGFSFLNTAAMDIAVGANKLIEATPEDEKPKPQPPAKPKAKTDMY